MPHLNWLNLFLTFIFWFLFIFTLIMIDPYFFKDIGFTGSYLPFFIIVFGTITFTINLFLKKIIRSLVYATALTICLYLQLYHLLTIINTILIFALILVLEFLFGYLKPKTRTQKVHSKHHPDINHPHPTPTL